jgi:hypothetical protein
MVFVDAGMRFAVIVSISVFVSARPYASTTSQRHWAILGSSFNLGADRPLTRSIIPNCLQKGSRRSGDDLQDLLRDAQGHVPGSPANKQEDSLRDRGRDARPRRQDQGALGRGEPLLGHATAWPLPVPRR